MGSSKPPPHNPSSEDDTNAPSDHHYDSSSESENLTGNYWEVDVHHRKTEASPTRRTYLRLGAPAGDPTSAGHDRGGDLAGLVTGFIDDDRTRGYSDAEADEAGGHGLTKSERAAESADLHTKGGWREHSEGNRISTTRGDRVDVVRGNYRLLVLGRKDAADEDAAMSDGAFWESSGGLHQDGDVAPGSVSEIKWVESFDGTWRVIEECEKGDTISRYHGTVKEYFFGPRIESYVGGTEDGPGAIPWNSRGGITRDSGDRPDVVDKTWADEINELIDASKITSDTKVSGEVKETVTVDGAVTEDTKIGGALTSSTSVGGSLVDATQVGGAMVESTNIFGAKIDHTAVGFVSIEHKAVGILSLNSLEAGVTVEIEKGIAKFEIESHSISGEITLGKHLEYASWDEDNKIHKHRKWLTSKFAVVSTDTTAVQRKNKVLQYTLKGLSVALGS